MATRNKLTDRQERFVQEYLVDLNATQAAIRAGYSKKSAASTGNENLQKPEIQARISQAQHERTKRTQITQDMVLQELAKVAFSNMRDVASWSDLGVSLRDSATLDDKTHGAVKKIKDRYTFGEDGEPMTRTVEIELHDKIKALEITGRHLGMWDGSGKDKTTRDRTSNLGRILGTIDRLRKERG